MSENLKLALGYVLVTLAAVAMFALMLVLVWAFYWLACVAIVNLLGWFGVAGFPKPFPWWVPFALAIVTSLFRSGVTHSDKGGKS